MTPFSPERVVMFSGSGIAVRGVAPGNVPSFHHGFTPDAGSICPSLPFPDGSLSLRCLFCSARVPVLLGSYASRVVPWVLGFLSSCHPSGGASLVLQYMRGLGELLRTSGGRVFLSDCTLTSWPWPGLGVFG